MFYEQLKELKLDARTGEAIHYARSGQRESYYIPFSKKTVDQIIAGPAHSKESIKFIVKFASEDSPAGQMRAATRGQFSYDQFANWTFSDLYKLHIKPWDQQIPNIGPTTRMYK